MSGKFKLLTTLLLLLTIVISGCGGVRMTDPKQVAGGFCKAILDGDIDDAIRYSTFKKAKIKALIAKYKGKYKDVSVLEFLEGDTYFEKITFIPNSYETGTDKVMKIKMVQKANNEFAVAEITDFGELSKEQVVKLFVKNILSNEIAKLKQVTKISSGVLSNIAKKLKGFTDFEILQISQDDPNVMVEVKKQGTDESKTVNLKIIKKDKKYFVETVSID